jgi:pteridine reductase
LNQANTQAAKTVLVTGGAKRIGAAIITRFHCVGFNVIIHCNYSLNQAQALAAELNQQRKNSALVIQKDLSSPNASEELVRQTLAFTGRLDVLVNNASIFSRTDLSAFDADEWDALFNTNVKAPLLLSLASRAALERQEGAIINLTDIHAERPLKGYAVYCQSKAALVMQTKALAVEFAPRVRVNAIAPGAIVWPEQENALSDAAKQKIIAKTPLQRHGDPAFIAQAVLALAQNSFITGQILRVDGGRSILS